MYKIQYFEKVHFAIVAMLEHLEGKRYGSLANKNASGLQRMFKDFKMNIIKNLLQFVSCNFGLKSNLGL